MVLILKVVVLQTFTPLLKAKEEAVEEEWVPVGQYFWDMEVCFTTERHTGDAVTFMVRKQQKDII